MDFQGRYEPGKPGNDHNLKFHEKPGKPGKKFIFKGDSGKTWKNCS